MTDQAKRTAGMTLVLAAVVLAVAALLLWQKASDDAEHDQLVDEYVAVLGGGPAEEVDADRTLPIAVAGLAAVSFVGGVIFLATSRPDDD